MNLKMLENTPSWEWPEDAVKEILAVLKNPQADIADRLLAAELAGDYTVLDNDIAAALLAIVANGDEDVDVRCEAVLSLSPALEQADIIGYDSDEDVPISEALFKKIKNTLKSLYADAQTPVELRRIALESAVRAPEGWHEGAVRAAYASKDDQWKLTAIYCMGFIIGFDRQILDSLESDDTEIQYQAVVAAGNWGLKEAWPYIAALLQAEEVDKMLLMAAIEAVPGVRPEEAYDILSEFTNDEDDEIAETAMEALAMVEMVDDYENGDFGEKKDDD